MDYYLKKCPTANKTAYNQDNIDFGRASKVKGRHRGTSTHAESVLFLTRLLAVTLASERRFHSLFFAGLQVVGVTLDLLDNVFLLHLALQTPQRVLEGFSLLDPYFCQSLLHPPTRPTWTG